MIKYTLEEHHSYIAQLVLNAIHFAVPDLFDKIQETTAIMYEIEEKEWKGQSNPHLLELQDDIIGSLCELFRLAFQERKVDGKEPAGEPVTFTQKIIQTQRKQNPLASSKTKSEKFISLKSGSTELPPAPLADSEMMILPPAAGEKDLLTFDSSDESDNNSEYSLPTLPGFDIGESYTQVTTSLKTKDPEEFEMTMLYPDAENQPAGESKENKSAKSDIEKAFEPLSVDIFELCSPGKSQPRTNSSQSISGLSEFDEFDNDKKPSKTELGVMEENSFYNPFFFDKPKKSSTFSCPICLNRAVPIDGSMEIENCNHRFCFSCLKQYISMKINSKEVTETQLICPKEDCQVKLSTILIQGIVDERDWERYQEYSTSHQLEYEIHYGLGMRCPNSLCKNILFFDSMQEKRTALNDPVCGYYFFCDPKYNGCNQSFCINCKAIYGQVGPSHLPHSCEEQQQRLLNNSEEQNRYERWNKLFHHSKDTEFQTLIQKEGLRACPVCSVTIQKTEGCDHMHCTICDCNFCYVCGKYNRLNPKKRGDCGPKHGDQNWYYPDDL